ncbi:hypothetical protein Sinac_6673 [Singulisphaera acidiphila DSM 18658]|uniref:Uncharacterized protein n=2 Tax=Singulisphaera acidiphila TaxID=466153 RepID=L0DNB4_SINAD|nr:hypothetical protein Sinac_6673 [Singulisphaera acidiphila DSM 18658]
MVLRLILVGLVAGLGLSMPSRRDLDTMTRSAQHWVNDHLAEWDTPTLSDPGAFVLVVDPAETSPLLAAPASACAPTLISDEEFAGVLNDSVASFAQDALAGTTREMDQFVKNSDQLAALELSRSLAIDLPSEPAALADDEPNRVDLTELAFEGWAEETTPSKPVELADSNVTDSLDLVFEGVIEDTVTRFDQDASMLAATVRGLNADQTFGVNEDLDTDEIYASNRSSDGIQGSNSAAAADEAVRSENRLTNAVRLTREAVVAWASLIHGPAVVTIAP